jgi:hypothetical protein
MNVNRKLFVLFFLLALVLGACTAAPAESKQVDLQFVAHPAMGMPEQDVYVEAEEGSGEVIRVVAEEVEAYADAPVYGTGAPVAHDLFALDEALFGPHPKGVELGFTMGEWVAAGGHGTYTVTGDKAEIDIMLHNLVPDGVYTIWCARVSFPPNYGIVDKPCGAQDGSENTVVADADGNITFQLEMNALEESTAESVNVIAAAYHSDGQTYGEYPGDFGLNSHVHIVSIIPAPDDAAWRTISGEVAAAQ